jgi:hypothetical protein
MKVIWFAFKMFTVFVSYIFFWLFLIAGIIGFINGHFLGGLFLGFFGIGFYSFSQVLAQDLEAEYGDKGGDDDTTTVFTFDN